MCVRVCVCVCVCVRACVCVCVVRLRLCLCVRAIFCIVWCELCTSRAVRSLVAAQCRWGDALRVLRLMVEVPSLQPTMTDFMAVLMAAARVPLQESGPTQGAPDHRRRADLRHHHRRCA